MKKRVLIIIVIAFGFFIIGGIYMLFFNSSDKIEEPVLATQPVPTKQPKLTEQTTLGTNQPNINDLDIEVGSFNLSDLKSEYSYHGDNVGRIDDAQTAIEKARELWIKDWHGYYYFDEEPNYSIKVYYDDKEECWYLHGTLSPDNNGRMPHALIKRDGTVLNVWSIYPLPTERKFSLSDYKEKIYYYNNNIDVFGDVKFLGSVDNEEDALEKGKSVLIELYSAPEREYKAYFDNKSEVWGVFGSLPHGDELSLGGVIAILFQKSDGKILAVWGEK